MPERVAIVGMACLYPEARNPQELFENAIAQRRAFRHIPPERLRIEDYFSSDAACRDATYIREAALIEGYEFDRIRFKVPAGVYRAADISHWIALETASRAIADAGFLERELPRERTGVLVGNTLTGDGARAQILRLRWPYVRRVVQRALAAEDWAAERLDAFLSQLESDFKAPFAVPSEESLAGGLSNTIAGRICSHFDLRGGGFTIDGACASSLLAVSNACASLRSGELDVAIVGGVDISIDPFELVGFARLGALARGEMRVLDAQSGGFLPGEGCGFVVLMRAEDAGARGLRTYATICGWGVSSDGSGGITRPEAEGQKLALSRAYARAGFGPNSVSYFEAHGTGTSVGDATELAALNSARAGVACVPAVVSSIKANIGHTKAAAGIAGLIKASLALHRQILPPTTGCREAHREFGEAGGLEILAQAIRWPASRPLRAGVSAIGFGGINSHIVLEGATASRLPGRLAFREAQLARSVQDCELLVLSGADREELVRELELVSAAARQLSWSELADLANTLYQRRTPGRVRAALVVARPSDVGEKVSLLRSWLEAGESARLDVSAGAFLWDTSSTARVGFVFPGQGAPPRRDLGIWSRRFDELEAVPATGSPAATLDSTLTSVMQPAIVRASLAGLRILELLGVGAHVAIGHSLGELSALTWAGAFDAPSALRFAAERGRAMAKHGDPDGAMAALSGAGALALAQDSGGVIAAYNGAESIVVSGTREVVSRIVGEAQERGIAARVLPVSHAFHSPLVAASTGPIAEALAREDIRPVERTVVSTVTGRVLERAADLRELLTQQVTEPVRFQAALRAPEARADLWIEVGPGATLASLIGGTSVVSLDVGGESLRGLLKAAGAAFVLGVAQDLGLLFETRVARPLDLSRTPRFITNPCEERGEECDAVSPTVTLPEREWPAARPDGDVRSALEEALALVASVLELPLEAVAPHHELLADLHVNSIAVVEIVVRLAERLGRTVPAALDGFVNSTVGELAEAVERFPAAGAPEQGGVPRGVAEWQAVFQPVWVESETPARSLEVAPGEDAWEFYATAETPWPSEYREAVRSAPGGGVALWLGTGSRDAQLAALLEAKAAVLERGDQAPFVLLHEDSGCASFVRSLHVELGIDTCVIELPLQNPAAAIWLRDELRLELGFREVRYDTLGKRSVRMLRQQRICAAPRSLLGAEDVILVTGGGKGIAFESALGLARSSGARLALIGRAVPEQDADLAANLARLSGAGVEFAYASADVCDAAASVAAVRELERRLGSATALVHAAGVNRPRSLRSVDRKLVQDTVAPKVHGLQNVLAAVDSSRLRLLVTFGSIIGEIGLEGEAHYALANEWLARTTEEWGAAHPHCKSLCIEWSVWSEVGMGVKLQRVEALESRGISAIPPERGVELLALLVSAELPASTLVVAGRFGAPATGPVEGPELPFWRFLERPRVYYPSLELICDFDVSVGSDPYVEEHKVGGKRIFPAVLGLEAMAQAAAALVPEMGVRPEFDSVEFLRPIVIDEARGTLLRLAALVRGDAVEVELRSEQGSVEQTHFRATCRVAAPGERGARLGPVGPAAAPLKFDPAHDLYGSLLFHEGRFRALQGYQHLSARECLAALATRADLEWFAPSYPGALLLGSPALRDAAIHAIQACIPGQRILPTAVDRISIGVLDPAAPVSVHAVERSRGNGRFVYDLDVMASDGRVVEQWRGLELRRLSDAPAPRAWPLALLGPHLERCCEGVAPGLRLRLETRSPALPGRAGDVHDLAVSGAARVAGCVERVEPGRGAPLGETGSGLVEEISRTTGESLEAASVRVALATRCAERIDPEASELELKSVGQDGWVSFQAGDVLCLTLLTHVQEAASAALYLFGVAGGSAREGI